MSDDLREFHNCLQKIVIQLFCNTTIGSTRKARRAGASLAQIAMADKNKELAINVVNPEYLMQKLEAETSRALLREWTTVKNGKYRQSCERSDRKLSHLGGSPQTVSQQPCAYPGRHSAALGICHVAR